MLPIFAAIGTALGLIGDIGKGILEKKRAKQDAQLRIIEAIAKAKVAATQQKAANDFAWENTQIQNSGWKDEYWTLVLSIPAIMCFVPGLVEYVRQGFLALTECPDWYKWALLVAVSSAFGYKKLADFMALKKGV